jgi:hypothetical protein
MCGLDSTDSGHAPVVDPAEYVKERSGYVKGG